MKSSMITSLVGVAVGASLDASSKDHFIGFVQKFNKNYASEDMLPRFQTFMANLKIIEEHNAKNLGWTMGVTEFTDMTDKEFSAMFKGYNHRENNYSRSQNLHVAPKGQVIANDIDWTTKNAVTPVKDQGQCGSCWAFSTTGGVEGAVAVKTGKLTSVSEQQLVDCAGASGNQGCNGGLMDDAFNWIIKNGGIAGEDAYKYTAKAGTCNKAAPSVSQISGFKDIAAKSETDLMSALQLQPVSIAVDAENGWQMYAGGVMKTCTGKSLDHGVLLVGAGTDAGVDYWKVKNSWGAQWGESGFIRLKRGMDACGLSDAASYPTV